MRKQHTPPITPQTISVPLNGNVKEDWDILKPLILQELTRRKWSYPKLAEACEQVASYPLVMPVDTVQKHFSYRYPSSPATIHLYLQALSITIK